MKTFFPLSLLLDQPVVFFLGNVDLIIQIIWPEVTAQEPRHNNYFEIIKQCQIILRCLLKIPKEFFDSIPYLS